MFLPFFEHTESLKPAVGTGEKLSRLGRFAAEEGAGRGTQALLLGDGTGRLPGALCSWWHTGKALCVHTRAKQRPCHKVPCNAALAKLRRIGDISDTINETLLKKPFANRLAQSQMESMGWSMLQFLINCN